MEMVSLSNMRKLAEKVNSLNARNNQLKTRNETLENELLDALYEKEKYRCELTELVNELAKTNL